MEKAVCIRCGSFKRLPFEKCTNCGFAPVTQEDCARSLMLSEAFDVGEETFGLTPAELRAAANTIRVGGKYTFDPKVLARVMTEHEFAKSITYRRLILDGVRWLLPVLLLFALGFWLLAHFRR